MEQPDFLEWMWVGDGVGRHPVLVSMLSAGYQQSSSISLSPSGNHCVLSVVPLLIVPHSDHWNSGVWAGRLSAGRCW